MLITKAASRKVIAEVALLTVLCGCVAPTQMPAPTSAPPTSQVEETFNFQVRIEGADGKDAGGIEVMLLIDNQPPNSTTTDSRGMALFSIPTPYKNKVGRVVVKAQKGNETYELNVVLAPITPPQQVLLSRSETSNPATELKTPAPTAEITPATLLPEPTATTLASTTMSLEDQLLAANILLSKGGKTQEDSVRNGLVEGNGYAWLAKTCLKVIGNKRLKSAVPLDEINRGFKQAIGQEPDANIPVTLYENLDGCKKGIPIAFANRYGTDPEVSLDSLLEDRAP